jgi:hypothetical protein
VVQDINAVADGILSVKQLTGLSMIPKAQAWRKLLEYRVAVLRFDSCQGISCFSDALAPPRNSDSRSWDPKRNRTCLQTFLVAERFDGSRMYRCCIVVAELAPLARNMAKSASPEYKRGHYWNTGFRQSTRSCRPSEEFPRF